MRRSVPPTPILLPILALLTAAAVGAAVDPDWLRLWLRVQEDRPAEPGTIGRIAPMDEPGVPLVIHGRVFAPDGETPVPDVIVFAYHTDRHGKYSGADGTSWRLRGWARTGAAGRFELHTIRPGPYPGRRVPAHVHFTFEDPVRGRQLSPSLRFADDPLVGAEERKRSTAAGRFGSVCDVEMKDGVVHVTFRVRLKPRPDF
ncbi:MAG: hypothetical protein PVF68_06295 [Acidobacteriota bacterium]|jgi:protocatechuate 3,4-dioxygenase beta subunit